MDDILKEFEASLARIKNNFYFSFLAVNFLQNKPFTENVTLPVQMQNNEMTSDSLNNFNKDGIDEYANSIRRHFLNDIVIAYERYSMTMLVSHQNDKTKVDPATINDRNLGAHRFENMPNIYEQSEKDFFTQLRRLRNSIVHYNGVYSATNVLNYTFDNETYDSNGKEGQPISIKFDTILWIYNKLLDFVRKGNHNYVIHHLST